MHAVDNNVDWISVASVMQFSKVSIFGTLGLKTPIHAPKVGFFGGI